MSAYDPKRTFGASFDHFVSSHEQSLRHRDAKGLGGLEVDDQLEFGWLHDRQVGRLFAFEYFGDIDACLAVAVRKARSIADETTGNNVVPLRIDRRYRVRAASAVICWR